MIDNSASHAVVTTAEDPVPLWPVPGFGTPERAAWEAERDRRYGTVRYRDPTPEELAAHRGSVPLGRIPDPEDMRRENARIVRELHEKSWRTRLQREQDEHEREMLHLELRREMRELDRADRILAGEFIPDPRPETDEGHLMWLRQAFGDREFTTAHVRDAALAGEWIAPPAYVVRDGHWRQGTTWDSFDPAAPRFVLRLGQAYAALAAGNLVAGWLWIAPGGVTHNRRRWQVSAKIAYP